MSDIPIRVRGLTKRYSRFVLETIDLELRAGRVLGLIGPNGAGKSTLLRILMGLVRPDRGEVTVLGRPMPADEAWIKQRVGFVSEDMSLYPGKTLRWHMDLVGSVHEGWDERSASGLLARFGLNPDHKVRGMSRGQQVKSLLLLALARGARLLLLDEPTAGLDPLMRHELVELLAESRREGRTIVFSSHHGEDVSALADEVLFLHGGRVLARDDVAGFLRDGQSLEAAFRARVAGLARGTAA